MLAELGVQANISRFYPTSVLLDGVNCSLTLPNNLTGAGYCRAQLLLCRLQHA